MAGLHLSCMAAWLHEPHHVLDGGAVQPDVGPRLHSEQGSLSFANKNNHYSHHEPKPSAQSYWVFALSRPF